MRASTLTTHANDRSDFERLLDEAGIDYILVDRCPHPACEICGWGDMRVAA